MTALTLPEPLIGIDLGGVLPSDLLTVPLSQIVRLLPADAPPLSTVQVSLWWTKNQPKKEVGI